MTIDLKNYRIRLYRQTLHLLNKPQYIQFFVNPEKHILALKPGSAQDVWSQKVYLKTLHNKRKCCEFYSKPLIMKLRKLINKQTGEYTYKLLGRINTEQNRVFFNLNEAEPIREETELELTL